MNRMTGSQHPRPIIISRYPSVRARHSAVFAPPTSMSSSEAEEAGQEGTLLIFGGNDDGR